MRDLYYYSQTSEVQRHRRALIRLKILQLLADGQRRRSKDVAKELGISVSINSCTRILTDLHEQGKVCRTEAPDDRETNRVLVAWFYREQEK
jgi:predicted transcriptional regulator